MKAVGDLTSYGTNSTLSGRDLHLVAWLASQHLCVDQRPYSIHLLVFWQPYVFFATSVSKQVNFTGDAPINTNSILPICIAAYYVVTISENEYHISRSIDLLPYHLPHWWTFERDISDGMLCFLLIVLILLHDQTGNDWTPQTAGRA